MPQKYAGRVTLILVILFVGLFGIPWITSGIFNQSKLFDTKASFNERLNLKPGIDIAGGTSLVYEIKPPPGGFRGAAGTLAEQVASILKKRVDPTGTRNLIWRPTGDTRLEIQLPRSTSSRADSAQVKEEYRKLIKAVRKYNITYSQVVDAVENLKGDARKQALAKLAKGSEVRARLFDQLCQDFDKLKGFEAQQAEARKAEKDKEAKILQAAEQVAAARIAYDNDKKEIEPTNVNTTQLEALLGSANAELRNRELADIKSRVPADVKAQVEELEKIYPKYQSAQGTIDDATDLKRLLRGSGVLEFHIMVNNPRAEYPDMITRLQTEGPVFKAGDQTRWYDVARPDQYGRPMEQCPRDGKWYALGYVTPDKSMVHTEGGRDWHLQRSYPEQSRSGELVVGFEFDDTGAGLFRILTGNNRQQPLGTILDNKVITAPNINDTIGKSGIIEGHYTERERNYLINTLNAGSLPAQLADEPISEREVAPTLGVSNLRAGLLSCVIGLVVIAIFMIVYYHLSGVVAAIALLFNMTTIIGILAMMGATFTLPGIAGLVLTIGVSVDANVLIFERLREEERRGLSLKLALRNAYDRAFTAILDSNVTTAITSAFLVYFGSEEVKGFGLTLLIGILSSMFAALFVTKTIFAVLLDRFGVKKLGSFPLSNPWWERLLHPKWNWMGLVPWFLGFSTVFAVLGMIAFFQNAKSGSLLDVEFASGTKVQFTTKQPMADGDIQKLLEKKPDAVPQPTIVGMGSADKNGKYTEFSVVTANADRRQVEKAIIEVMKTNLNTAVPSHFELSNPEKPADTFAQALQKNVVVPIVLDKNKNNRFYVGSREVPEAQQFVGGVAVVLNNLDPALPPGEIQSRVVRSMEQSGDTQLGQIETVRLDGETDDERPTTSAVVMIANPNLSYVKSETDWREKLALPMWKDVNAGVGREASLQEVSNFDAQVAGDTQKAAIFATLGSLIAIMIWIWLRFGDHKYGTATVVAMVHDVILVVGAVGLSHWLAGTVIGNILGVDAFRVNMTLVAAILTIMGYSMVDTIVVFDRIRENRGKYGTLSSKLINDSISQTLSRTLLTAGTTLATVAVMYIWGGPAIHGFTYVLLVGILIGTYSSIAIASPILLIGVKQPAQQKAKPETGGAVVPTT